MSRPTPAVTINGLVRWTVTQGAAGLEAWAGTPGTVGGRCSATAHFGGRSIGEHVRRVRLATRDGREYDVAAAEMAFGYDRSRLQTTGEVLLAAAFAVTAGEPAALRATARQSLAFRKADAAARHTERRVRVPESRAGRDRVPDGVPWSAGALVDSRRVERPPNRRRPWFHWRTAISSSTTGSATAADIRRLIEHCRRGVRERLGVELREEIVYLGELMSTLLIEGGRPLSAASRSKATRTPRCRCWRHAC